MAKIKLTRPELKRQRDVLTRFQRYLPMLKLKQQMLQSRIREIQKKYLELEKQTEAAQKKFDAYQKITSDLAGINLAELSACSKINSTRLNIAGVNIPIYESVEFPEVNYSLFGTPAWVDRALLDLRDVNELKAQLQIVKEQYELLQQELTKIIQRVNLFEKVKIPEAKEIIRLIRIKLGDEMTAAVGRGKIAKGKIPETNTYSDFEDELKPEAQVS